MLLSQVVYGDCAVWVVFFLTTSVLMTRIGCIILLQCVYKVYNYGHLFILEIIDIHYKCHL